MGGGWGGNGDRPSVTGRLEWGLGVVVVWLFLLYTEGSSLLCICPLFVVRVSSGPPPPWLQPAAQDALPQDLFPHTPFPGPPSPHRILQVLNAGPYNGWLVEWSGAPCFRF